ncbi:Mov34/MPN/PAD-1 family protein [Fictibacillus enclensis]|uniref:Mov34/MPN/PAD-1 family protein n=1 Tax=Fictibacillus enclensis TaxID=1017270 RepID=UPI0025A026AD|nr:Mov34/MPN/PAD-1 family protein [Fictibacillus enclensis]MDM5196528.1 Mov34/MPN/PAD-1 family protein [Fictibacillus enclensis]
MNKYKQLQLRDKEAGGILIGRILIEDGNYIIDDVSEPMPADKRTRTRFSRQPAGHQEYFDQVWENENGRCFYLGEWHTHPEGVPHPSSIDRKDWERLLSERFEPDYLFFIIVGIKAIRVWAGVKSTLTINELVRRG